VGENINFSGPEGYLRQRGVELTVVNDPECIEMMRKFITDFPLLWNEDIGV
jgi:cytosine deaminase